MNLYKLTKYLKQRWIIFRMFHVRKHGVGNEIKRMREEERVYENNRRVAFNFYFKYSLFEELFTLTVPHDCIFLIGNNDEYRDVYFDNQYFKKNLKAMRRKCDDCISRSRETNSLDESR